MPHPGTASPGEGESATISPVLPSANAYPDSSEASSSSYASSSSSSSSASSVLRIFPSARSAPLSTEELRQRADLPHPDPGAAVDLKVEQMRVQAGSSSSSSEGARQEQKLEPPKGWLHFVAGG
jgi:solute carrier family 25 protein 33/36